MTIKKKVYSQPVISNMGKMQVLTKTNNQASFSDSHVHSYQRGRL